MFIILCMYMLVLNNITFPAWKDKDTSQDVSMRSSHKLLTQNPHKDFDKTIKFNWVKLKTLKTDLGIWEFSFCGQLEELTGALHSCMGTWAGADWLSLVEFLLLIPLGTATVSMYTHIFIPGLISVTYLLPEVISTATGLAVMSKI